VTRSQWNCSLEIESLEAERDGAISLRMGLCYVRGLTQAAGEALVREKNRAPFTSVDDIVRRVPELSRDNLAMLARIGALNNLASDLTPHVNPDVKLHRRDALWQVEKAVRKTGPLLEGIVEIDSASPLRRMNVEERMVADYHGTGLTTGHHPMAYRREILRKMGVRAAIELKDLPHGKEAAVAGCVITRQRPGTAKGIIFMTLEDETGTSRVIIMPDFYDENRQTVLSERFVLVSGIVQNQENVVHLKARRIEPLAISAAPTPSHDFR
jgi:error-prone DNA polymerase